MALYRIHFVDQRDDIERITYAVYDSDEAAIEAGIARLCRGTS